jgi:hypothetical protein
MIHPITMRLFKIKKPHIAFHPGRDAYADWSIMLAAAFIVACGLAVAGYFSYSSVGERLSAEMTVSPSASATPFDPAALSRLMVRLDASDADRAAALKGYAGPGDPSL